MPKISKETLVINFLVIALLIIGILMLAEVVEGTEAINNFVLNYGYIGLFLVSIVSGFNVVVPIPAITLLPLLVSAGLNFWVIVIITSIGITIGDGVGCLVGRSGRLIIDDKNMPKFLSKAEDFLKKRPDTIPVALFIYAAFVPIPNELLVVPASFLEKRWWRILPPVLVGNFIFNLLFAFGLVSIPGVL